MNFQYQPLDLTNPTFRLLRLLKDRGVEIECDLFNTSFLDDDCLPYEALSYVWGHGDLVERITLNQKIFWVTDNLYAALRHLQQRNEDRILWIDALCIDQGNNEEKGQQVQQMGTVYSYAQRVVFWLGKATTEIYDLMEFLEELQRNHSEEALELRTGSKPPTPQTLGNLDSLRKGLRTIFKRPWFQRVWILQEVANARTAVVCLGAKSISAHVFAVAHKLLGLDPEPFCQVILDIMPGSSRKTSWWSQDRNLCTLLLKFRGNKATDERDKIYALLGLLPEEQNKWIIQPDYTKTVKEVVQEAIKALIGSAVISTQEILDFLASFTSINATLLVPPTRGQTATEILFLPLQSRNKIIMKQELFETQPEDKLEIMRHPSLFCLDDRHEETSHKEAIGDEHVTFYDQLAELLLDNDNTIISKNLMSTKEAYGTLQGVSWKAIERNVRLLVIGESWRAFMKAALMGKKRIVKVLAEKSAIWDPEKHSLNEAVHEAALYGHEEVLQLLHESGADINARGSRFYKNVLQSASERGDERMARLLLKMGADVNAGVGSYEGTSLYLASKGGKRCIVRLLLECGADLSCPGDVNDVLQAAARSGDKNVVHLLLEKGFDARKYRGSYGKALQAASRAGYVDVVQLLLESAANAGAPAAGFVDDVDALQSAARYGHQHIVQMLFNEGADINRLCRDHGSALHAASAGGHKQIVQLLLNNGANIHQEDRSGRTALQEARFYRQEYMVQLLLEKGAHDIKEEPRPPLFDTETTVRVYNSFVGRIY